MTVTPAEAREYVSLLEGLYREQAAVGRANAYLDRHGQPAAIKHRVNLFCWYRPYLPERGTVLDWGCNHGPDSCLLRQAFGDQFELHGCDFPAETEHQAFRAYARPHYTRLTGVVELPYPESTFDAVLGSGVLEHTAMDGESLKALYRVLKPDGVLVISYLPYRGSLHEWYLRTLKKRGHRRLYGRGEITRMLQRFGFYPLEVRFQTFVPNVVDGKPPTWPKRLLAPLRYPPFAHDVLCCVAKKVLSM